MTYKPAPCTAGNRHKWTHVKNVTLTTMTTRTTTFSHRGIYRCECGEKKVGASV